MRLDSTSRVSRWKALHSNTVSITGIGLMPPGRGSCGTSFWPSLVSGPPLIGPLTRFKGTFKGGIAGEVPAHSLSQFIDSRTLRTTCHAVQLGIVAARRAFADGWQNQEIARFDSTLGLLAGTALAGWVQAEQQFATFLERGAARVNPFLANGAAGHATGGELASRIGAQGIVLTLTNGCTSSTQAIGDAARLIAEDELQHCLAGGTESPLSPMVMATLARTEELASQYDHPETASRPFDRRHDGMVLSEGACFLLLENGDQARERGARVYAEVLGGSSSCDARGLYHFDETGETGARAIHRLLERTGVTPDQIDYICAHANSSPAFDRKEVTVLKRAFGEFAAKIPVSSIKGVLGHPFGASGAFQTAAAALAMQHSLIPHTHNLEEPAPECDLDLVMGEPRPATIRHALITSYGYGGINAYLLLRNPHL